MKNWSGGGRRPRGFHHIGMSIMVLLAGLVLGPARPATAQENADCLTCHEDRELTGERNGTEIPVFVDQAKFAASVHGDLQCIACHSDLEGTELPHAEDLEPVDCTKCHDDVVDDLKEGPHGKWALEERGGDSQGCVTCHGYHDVLGPDDPSSTIAAGNVASLCRKCHEDEVRSVARGIHGKGEERPNASCVDCHRGHSMVRPRTEDVEIKVCGACHPDEVDDQRRSVHARAALKGDPLAPSCITCHQHHEVLPKDDPRSPTSTLNVPILCGRCHREGTDVSQQRDIPQAKILENYSMSIHGEGLFKMGLTVTAVCTSCHNSHLILDHRDPGSSINPANVAKTCTRCHARIEEVHVKVINGKLWEEQPHKIPACVDCHQPHKIRRTPLNPQRVANKECMRCHSDKNLTMEKDGKTISLFIDEEAYNLSTHANVACAQCHTEVSTAIKRPCAAIKNPVDCSVCHAEVVSDYTRSTHGTLAAKGDPDAPRCLTCHSAHATQSHLLPTSPTFARNVPELCGKCHRKDGPAGKRIQSDVGDIVESYVHSVHGKGLLEAGLVVSATCTDCHTNHRELPAEDPESSVNPAHVADTCGTCHKGIEEVFRTSVHWPGNIETDRKLPTCEDCHTSHTIRRIDTKGFRTMMMNQCGKCHEHEAETFFDTVHGKVSRLGEEGAAKCYDCHGRHNILPPDDPRSTLSYKNVVDTCGQCHKGSHRQFAGYLTHATHHDPKKYPYLYYTWLFMTALLVGTLAFFMVHTLMWLFRLWRTREQWGHLKTTTHDRFYVRFTTTQRIMHLVMILSFFTLAITGMTLKFSYMGWAVVISRILGGFKVTGLLHRIAAVTLLALFLYHVRQIFKFKAESGKTWIGFIFGKDSMMFNLNDIKQFWQSILWFLGRGERPKFGRFTYWEKFDYFAVFWGVFVIGSTGLMLWFPTFFTRFLPGWMINVATIIHSDEALLATAFIFTIHFFNTHFRPDKFPMDPVIFTGRVPLEELKHDKPAEYEDLMQMENPDERIAGSMPRKKLKVIRFFGFVALFVGSGLILLILYAMLFGYR